MEGKGRVRDAHVQPVGPFSLSDELPRVPLLPRWSTLVTLPCSLHPVKGPTLACLRKYYVARSIPLDDVARFHVGPSLSIHFFRLLINNTEILYYFITLSSFVYL